MKHFSQKIYFPLLDYLPKDWIEDFENILLRFEPSEHMIIASVNEDRSFTINIDLDKMQNVTLEQLQHRYGKEPKMTMIIFQFFGNMAYGIINAFYKYNTDKHPEKVKDKNSQAMTANFMSIIYAKAQKDLKKAATYIS